MNDRSTVADFDYEDDEGRQTSMVEVMTWLGESKGLLILSTLLATAIAVVVAFMWPPSYTARVTLLPPGSQQQSGSAAALASLGALGGLAGVAAKTPDELYVALLTSDAVLRPLDQRYKLKERYDYRSYEHLRKRIGNHVTVTADKKSGVILLLVTDRDPNFAAELANAHVPEIAKVLDRLAVSEAQQRRLFFEQQLQTTKEKLVAAEQDLRQVQERSGVIVLDKQAEALIGGAAQLRALISEREVQLRVLRTGATEQNPEVIRLNSELAGLRSELSRLESRRAKGDTENALDIPVARLPEAAIDYIRARRELKLQETLLESMIRQYEIARLDEAKEGQMLQQVDKALPPDYRSFPPRMFWIAGGAAAGLLLAIAWVLIRRYAALAQADDGEEAASWQALGRAWRLRG